MRRFAGCLMTAAVLALAVGCGKKDSTESGGGGGGSGSSSIEGTYTIVGMEMNGKDIPAEVLSKMPEEQKTVKITADKFIGMKEGKEKDEEPATYKIDASKSPKEIDMTEKKAKGAKGAKGKEKEEKMYGIYKMEGDKLTICMAKSDKSADRPKEFKTDPDGKTMMLTLQKNK